MSTDMACMFCVYIWWKWQIIIVMMNIPYAIGKSKLVIENLTGIFVDCEPSFVERSDRERVVGRWHEKSPDRSQWIYTGLLELLLSTFAEVVIFLELFVCVCAHPFELCTQRDWTSVFLGEGAKNKIVSQVNDIHHVSPSDITLHHPWTCQNVG